MEKLSKMDNAAALMFADIKNFKRINENFGHQAGDDVLRQVAGVLRDVAAGKGDVLRYSGDDFVTVFFKATEEELSEIQKELILQAADMLRPGGLMLYSTCTFAPAEDEQTVSWLLENRPDMELAEMEDYEGFSHGVPEWGNGNPELTKCIRIFPHKMNGEGHFLALFRKKGQAIKESSRPHTKPDKNAFPLIEGFLNEIGLKTLCGQPFDWERVEIRGDKAYYLPPVAHNFRGITFLRNGLYLGDLKKNRFEPSQPLALAIRKNEAEAVISLSASDERITRYLKGETLNIEPEEAAHKKGWHLLCADGYPIGFGKLVNQILKNKYPAGWRV